MPSSKKRNSKHSRSGGRASMQNTSKGNTNQPFADNVSETLETDRSINMEDVCIVDDLEEPMTAEPSLNTADDVIDIIGNGLLLKKTLRKGYGRETRPNHGDSVEVRYSGWLENGILVEEVSSLSFALGDGDVIQAFELALTLAERGELFELVTDSRFAYGFRGREPDIHGGAKLRYEIELVSANDPPCYAAMSYAQRFSAADQKRERGNYYYRRDEYAFAVNSYNKALEILTIEPDLSAFGEKITEEEQDNVEADENMPPVSLDTLDDLELKMHNNLAATQLKIQAYDAAIKSCDAVLRKDPSNFKALFRKGRAHLGQGDSDEAVHILQQVRELVPTSHLVNSELQRARVMQQKDRQRWARATSRAFPKSPGRTQHSSHSRLGRLRSLLFSRYVLASALLFAFLSILVAWYFKQLPSHTASYFSY